MTTYEILRYHAIQYPVMRPTDAIKLLYQNEFGGGHMIEDPNKSFAWLEKEYANIKHDKTQQLITPIGNGVVRYNLSALDITSMSLEHLNEIFVKSSRLVRGNMDSFIEKLGLLTDMTDKGLFTFSCDEMNEYLSNYKKLGFPPVSHSLEFKKAYSPSYRVVLKELLPL